MKDFSKEEIAIAYKVLVAMEQTYNEIEKDAFRCRANIYDKDGWRITSGTYNAITNIKNIIANKIAYDETK